MLDQIDVADVPQQEQEHARRLLRRIKAFQGDLDARAKRWELSRKYVNGDQDGVESNGAIRVNQIGSAIETIQPNIYAKAPEIAVSLDEQVDPDRYPAAKPFSKTLQAALNAYLVKDAKLKIRGKHAVRSALTATVGWVKVVYQIDKADDPLIRNRINDTQDNVDQIKVLVEETKAEGGDCANYDAKLFELSQQLMALEEKVEIITAEGLVVDNIDPEDVLIMDESCRDIDEFMQSGEIAHRIRMTVGNFKQQFRKTPPKQARRYTGGGDTPQNIDEDDQMIDVYEVWSKKDQTVYTLCEGAPAYIRAPFQPKTLGAQWYPFFGLQLRRVDGERYPMSLVEMAQESADEYNTKRTNEAEHRRKNLPVRLVNKAAGITNEEIAAICSRSINTDVIGVTVDMGTPLSAVAESLPEIPFNEAMYDVSDTLRDIETVMNVQDASRGAINQAKTATEAEIMSMGTQSRSGESTDIIEDWLTEIAIYSAQILLQSVPAAKIKERFGDEAVWPEIDKRTLFGLVNISIKAGSTSRPSSTEIVSS